MKRLNTGEAAQSDRYSMKKRQHRQHGSSMKITLVCDSVLKQVPAAVQGRYHKIKGSFSSCSVNCALVLFVCEVAKDLSSVSAGCARRSPHHRAILIR